MIVGRNNVIEQEDETMPVGVVVTLGVFGFMVLIAVIIGFHRIGRTVRGLDRASEKLMAAYRDRSELANITRSDAEIFEVSYLDRKYQEYLGFLRKTNSPCDISDYIGEYEINNYIHRRMIEMVPDILTSLGILGTFVGLVLGLRGFNPVSYEAMATSITSLVEGIKVAFVTSIYGIALSMAFSYSLRGAVSSVSESLDNFTDKYYVCAVPPTDATAMNHVLANQKENTRAIQEMGSQIGDQVGRAVTEQVTPVLDEMQRSLDHFTQVMTLNQQEMLENVVPAGCGLIDVKVENGVPRIATGHMFKFSDKFLNEILPVTIELGRSFVRPEYQSTREGVRALFALDNLWDGLGALTIIYPKVKYMFGKMTMYPSYVRDCRDMLLCFLNLYFKDKEGLVVPIDPLPDTRNDDPELMSQFVGNDFREDYKRANAFIRQHGINIPPLVNAYMGLSPKMLLLGTAINREFGDVEETGILINLDEIADEKKRRHIDSYLANIVR